MIHGMMTTIYTDLAAHVAVRDRQTSCCLEEEKGGIRTRTLAPGGRRPQRAPKVLQNEKTRRILVTRTNSFLFLKTCTSLVNIFRGTLTQSRKATHHFYSPNVRVGMRGESVSSPK